MDKQDRASTESAEASHTPVLFREVLSLLQPVAGGRYIDGTVGGGGHATGILDASAPDGLLLGLDRDPEAVQFAGLRLARFGKRVTLVRASFGDLAAVAAAHGFNGVDGILLDLGLSSRQLESTERGFSFLNDGPLDMRFNPHEGVPAADLVNNLSEGELADLFWRYGEEQQSRRIARLIVNNRPLVSTGELAGLIAGGTGRQSKRGRQRHPATKVFQALRIAVNDELAEIERGLNSAIDLLKPAGRLAVISFHSLEDRLVKQFLRRMSQRCTCPPEQPICTCGTEAKMSLITRKAVQASAAEVAENPRSRSARLRVATRVGH